MWLDYLRIAWSIVRNQKFRSVLTVGSITIGAFAIVIISSLSESGLASLNAGLEEIGGTRVLAVLGRHDENRRAHPMSYRGGLARQDFTLVRSLPHIVGMTYIADLAGRDLISETGQRLTVDAVAADAEFFRFFQYSVAAGRVFDDTDQLAHARVCVLGDEIAKRLAQPEPLLGRCITIMGLRCTIIGRLARVDRWGLQLGWDWDNVVVLPMETLAERASVEVGNSRWLLVHTDSSDNNEIAVRMINTLIRNRHNGLNDFYLINFHKSFLEESQRIFLIMRIVVGLLAGIALGVAGVGVMNIMLVSVSERVREIGIRKALGASPADIARQFLIEAMLLSSLGGVLGAALGLTCSLLAGLIIQRAEPRWLIALSQPGVLMALLASVLVGVSFGYYPARRASQLDAAAAIRMGL